MILLVCRGKQDCFGWGWCPYHYPPLNEAAESPVRGRNLISNRIFFSLHYSAFFCPPDLPERGQKTALLHRTGWSRAVTEGFILCFLCGRFCAGVCGEDFSLFLCILLIYFPFISWRGRGAGATGYQRLAQEACARLSSSGMGTASTRPIKSDTGADRGTSYRTWIAHLWTCEKRNCGILLS